MGTWLRRLRGAVGIGLTWAVGAALVGGGIELIHNIWPNPLGAAFDIWPAVLAYPALLGGMAFSAVLGIAGRRRRFDELSVARMALWGATGGVLVSLVPAALVGVGLATTNAPLWQITLALAGPMSLGGAAAASATLVLARVSEDRELLDTSTDVENVGLTEEERRSLLE